MISKVKLQSMAANANGARADGSKPVLDGTLEQFAKTCEPDGMGQVFKAFSNAMADISAAPGHNLAETNNLKVALFKEIADTMRDIAFGMAHPAALGATKILPQEQGATLVTPAAYAAMAAVARVAADVPDIARSTRTGCSEQAEWRDKLVEALASSADELKETELSQMLRSTMQNYKARSGGPMEDHRGYSAFLRTMAEIWTDEAKAGSQPVQNYTVSPAMTPQGAHQALIHSFDDFRDALVANKDLLYRVFRPVVFDTGVTQAEPGQEGATLKTMCNALIDAGGTPDPVREAAKKLRGAVQDCELTSSDGAASQAYHRTAAKILDGVSDILTLKPTQADLAARVDEFMQGWSSWATQDETLGWTSALGAAVLQRGTWENGSPIPRLLADVDEGRLPTGKGYFVTVSDPMRQLRDELRFYRGNHGGQIPDGLGAQTFDRLVADLGACPDAASLDQQGAALIKRLVGLPDNQRAWVELALKNPNTTTLQEVAAKLKEHGVLADETGQFLKTADIYSQIRQAGARVVGRSLLDTLRVELAKQPGAVPDEHAVQDLARQLKPLFEDPKISDWLVRRKAHTISLLKVSSELEDKGASGPSHMEKLADQVGLEKRMQDYGGGDKVDLPPTLIATAQAFCDAAAQYREAYSQQAAPRSVPPSQMGDAVFDSLVPMTPQRVEEFAKSIQTGLDAHNNFKDWFRDYKYKLLTGVYEGASATRSPMETVAYDFAYSLDRFGLGGWTGIDALKTAGETHVAALALYREAEAQQASSTGPKPGDLGMDVFHALGAPTQTEMDEQANKIKTLIDSKPEVRAWGERLASAEAKQEPEAGQSHLERLAAAIESAFQTPQEGKPELPEKLFYTAKEYQKLCVLYRDAYEGQKKPESSPPNQQGDAVYNALHA